MMKKVLALIIALILVVTYLPQLAYAEADDSTEDTIPSEEEAVQQTVTTTETTESETVPVETFAAEETVPEETSEQTEATGAALELETEPMKMAAEEETENTEPLDLSTEDTPAPIAEEASGTCGKDLTWVLDSDGTLTISGTGDMYSYTSGPITSSPWYNNYRDRISTVVIQSGITRIGEYAFYGCTSLTSVTIPSSVTSIGEYAFYGCTSLTNVEISNGVTWIGNCAFYGCTSLTSVTIPGSTNIGSEAFCSCTSLASVTISDGVTSIGIWAFKGCTSLTSVTIPSSVTSISASTFLGCSKLTSIVAADGNKNYSSVDGVLFNAEKTSLLRYPEGKVGSYTIPSGVTNIGSFSFEGCTSLTGVTIPGGVTSIGEAAFRDCTSLTSVAIPSNVTRIENYTFERCYNLTSVTIPTGLTRIGSYAFRDCTSLTSVTIPSSVTSIWWYAFGDCTSLTSVAIPSSITSIEGYAFDACTSLTDVYYGGSEEEWGQITIGDNNAPLFSATIHYNSTMPGGDTNPEPSKTCTLDQLTDVDYLAFSALSYEDLYANSLTTGITIREMLENKWDTYWGGTDIKHSELYAHIADWRVSNYYPDPVTGFAAYAFTNDDFDVVIAYRGSVDLTDFSDLLAWWNDWIANDIDMILGGKGDQISEAFSFYQRNHSQIGKTAVTGHSLGGGLADIVAARFGCKGVSFNSAPFLDVAYWYFPAEMSELFMGTNHYNFVDHANVNDLFVGNYPTEIIKPKIGHAANDGVGSHGLNSIITRNSNGELKLTDVVSNSTSKSVISQTQITAGYEIDLGTSGGNSFKLPILTVNLQHAIYGGDGVDILVANILADKLIGGKGTDSLDGSWGNDTYIYHKGDGVDTIYDVSGHDEVILYGFSDSDRIEVSDGGAVVVVTVNDEPILYISKTRSIINAVNPLDSIMNSFTIRREDQTSGQNIEDYLSLTKSYKQRLVIACPVDVEIYNELTGEVVYTLYDGEEGVYYTDYGNFYLAQEEDGGYAKVADLVDGYEIRIIGTDAGTMDIAVYDTDGYNLFDPYAASDVEVTDTMTATIEENAESGGKNLLIDYDGDGEIDEIVPLTTGEERYTVAYDANGGSGSMESETVTAGGEFTLPACGFTAPDGMQFKAWEVEGKEYAPDESIIVTADTTVKALWQAVSHTHNFGQWTDSGDGKNHTRVCDACGEIQTEAHNWDDGEVIKEATATEAGAKIYTCSACGATKKENIPMLPTSPATDPTTVPTTAPAADTTTSPTAGGNSNEDTAPKTGDNYDPFLWVALLTASAFGIIATMFYGRKKKYK